MDARTDLRRKLSRLGAAIRRMNQVVLSFPVWLVLGASALFQREERVDGWRESERNERWRRMY